MLLFIFYFIRLFQLIYNETPNLESLSFKDCVSLDICFVTSDVSKSVSSFTLDQGTTHNITSENDFHFSVTLINDFIFTISLNINITFNNLKVILLFYILFYFL